MSSFFLRHLFTQSEFSTQIWSSQSAKGFHEAISWEEKARTKIRLTLTKTVWIGSVTVCSVSYHAQLKNMSSIN